MTLAERHNGFEIVLCEYRTEKLWVTVRACIADGKLTVEGQDLGDAPLHWFGSDEYEYYYFFDEANTEKLLQLLAGDEKHPLKELQKQFRGLDACRTLRSFCEQNEIAFRFDCYY